MVVLTTSKTTTSWMFAVLSYTTVTSRYVAAVLASLGEMGGHFLGSTESVPILCQSHPKSTEAIQPRQLNAASPLNLQ